MPALFPPSSPFLEPTEKDDFDPFTSQFAAKITDASKKLVINSPFVSKEGTSKPQTFQYPTPNPSSTTGIRSSSPVRQVSSPLVSDRDESSPVTKKKLSTSIEPNVNYSDPLEHSLRVRLYSNDPVNLGRSSRCDYFVKSKYASRNHLKVKYSSESNELSVLCKGYNGVIVVLGEKYYGYIKELDENVYRFVKKDTQMVKNDEEIFTELTVFKNEQIVLPYNDKITLDIKGSKVLLDVVDDLSETEDELPVLNRENQSSELSLLPDDEVEQETADSFAAELQPLEHSKTIPAPSSELVLIAKELMPTPDLDEPIKQTNESTPAPATQSEFKTPLTVKSESALNQESHSHQRRRKAEPGLSPQKKKIDFNLTKTEPGLSPQKKIDFNSMKATKKYVNPRDKIQNLNIKEILAEVTESHEIESIKNVLINHLAFSRLSQTPLKQLQTVSQSVQVLSRYQLRAVLASIGCIGTIYRHGKDAAGKPLEEEYYYDVENDDDLDRTKLVASIKGSSGLRNCRKTHKQYFWKKPVTKK